MSPESPAPLLSPQWFRVATLRPRLDPQVQVERVSYRRERWFVLVHANGNRSFRLNPAAYAFAARCDGALSMQRLWELLLSELKDDAPTQDELLQLLARLHESGLMGLDRRPDFGAKGALSQAPRGQGEAARKNSLLSFRIPLGRPDPWLARWVPRLAVVFTRPVFVAWLLLIALGSAAAFSNRALLVAYADNGLATPRLLLLMWLAYPAVKALHELAHALMLRHFGGTVAEWGITLMMFTPVPYVDASAATALPRARQRLLVSAAGIMVELALAAAALLLALQVQPGLARDGAMAVFFIGSVSTLLVNGNPLLRFDGYHMLGDLLELPNLATRSARHWLEVLQRRVLRIELGGALQPSPGELPWLWAYAPAAWTYRLVISLALVRWVGGLSFALGTALGLYLGWSLFAQPLWRLLRWVWGTSLAEAHRQVALKRTLFGVGLALAALTLLPLPYASVAEGVLSPAEHARVRAGTHGFIAKVLAAEGQRVHVGDPLFALQDPMLEVEIARLDGQIAALETERLLTLRSDPAHAVSIEHELDRAQAERDRALERQEQLTVKAESEGVLALTHAQDLIGRHVKQGSVLAQILSEEPALVRVALPQDVAALVQSATRHVAVRLNEAPGTTWAGDWSPGPSGAVTHLPHAALGDRSGGAIVTEPGDKAGLTAAQAFVLTDVRLPGRPATRLGGRATVRFDHGYAPLMLQGARRLQQWVLAHFNPAQ